MYFFRQSTGEMLRGNDLVSAVVIGVGHAGNGTGLNNPSMQEVRDVGPLPRGLYTIEPFVMGVRDGADAKLGPVTARLNPDPGNEMFGRGGFFIHGPELSEGCIVMPYYVRVLMANSPATEMRLEVIA